MNKIVRIVCAWLFVVAFLIPSKLATAYKNYDSTPMSTEDADRFLRNSVPNVLLTEEGLKIPFKTFAISEDGQVALVIISQNKQIIYVYNTDGDFLYGYSLVDSDEVIFFEGEYLSVFWTKSGCIETLDSNGKTIQLHTAWNTGNNAIASQKDQHPPASGTIEEYSYQAEKDFFFSTTYTRFVLTDKKGVERVLYDATTSRLEQTIGSTILILVTCGLLFIFYKENQKMQCW